VESDPACVVTRVEDDLMRETMKHVALELACDAKEVLAGSTALLRLAIVNKGSSEIPVVLDAQPPGAIARPDWSRLAGVPEPKAVGSAAPPVEGFHLFLGVRTLDAHERPVDGLPWSPPAAAQTTPRLLRVRLRPGGRLTSTMQWWALRIPTPAPITRDDAGHRFVPKTMPVPLTPGEYVVAVDLPLHGVAPPESTTTTRIRVERVERDAGPH